MARYWKITLFKMKLSKNIIYPDILDEKVDATTSFEIFAGKRYWGTKADEDNLKNELNNRL